MAGTHDIARAAGTQDTVVKAIFGAIMEEVRNGGRVLIKGFGTFEKRRVNARTVHSPQIPNGSAQVPEHDVIKFRASPATKQVLNGGAAEEEPAPKPAAKPAAAKPANGAAKPAPKAAAPAKPAAKPVAKPAPKKPQPQPEADEATEE